MLDEANAGRTPRTETVVPPAEKHAVPTEEWVWYCPECDEELTRGEDAIRCTDPDECPNAEEWYPSLCGYVVHTECHRPAQERRRSL